MGFHELVRLRHSIRKYKSDAVPEDALRRILQAARRAPSAANLQPWHFYVVRDPVTKTAIFADGRQTWAAQAPVVIVACGLPSQAWVRKTDSKNHADVDIAIAMEHIVLAATEEGFGTCWICAFDPAAVREALKLPEKMEPIALTPLGYAEEQPTATERRPLEEITTWI